MRLTKKHIGGLFNVQGGDGSWVYQLLDVKNNELLFYTFGTTRPYEIESASYNDWRPFEPTFHLNKEWVKRGWKTGRRNP